MPPPSASLIEAALTMRRKLDRLSFAAPVSMVYNPLQYAWSAHEQYLTRYAQQTVKILFLGMNPGPWGMAQTGVPFGEVDAVRGWLNIDAPIHKPKREHPKRPIEGLECKRSEVSGRRLWGFFAERFQTPEKFFANHFVCNFCPLVFMDEGARNVTPDKLPASETELLDRICDEHLAACIRALDPTWLVGVGQYAENCLKRVASTISDRKKFRISRILHPSPASPAANKDWAGQAKKQLIEADVWQE